MKASQIIATAVAETVAKAQEAGLVTSDAELQAAGKAAMSLIMTTQPSLYAAYTEEVAEMVAA